MIPLPAAAVLFWTALAVPPPDGAPARLGPAAPLPPALATAVPPAAQRDRWFAEDKLRHFTVSFGGFNLAFGALRTAGLNREPAMLGATAVAAAAGLWKEWRDRRAGGPFSGKDLVWDGLGILAGLAVAANTR